MKRFVMFVVFATASALCLLGTAQAQSCRIGHPIVHHGPVYHHAPVHVVEKVVAIKEEVIVPVAVPVIVPTTVFQYVPALAPAVAAPAAAPAAPVAAAPSSEELDKLILKRIDAVLAKRLATAAPVQNGEDGPPPIQWGEAPKEKPASTKLDWVGFMKSHCASCHGSAKKAGGVSLFDTAGLFAPTTSKAAIVASIVSGEMPKGNPVKLTPEQEADLRRWANE